MGRIFKRRRPDAYTPLQMLQILSDLKLVAVLQGNSIWLSVDPVTAKLLDQCCTGQQDGGPCTAMETMSIINQWREAGGQALDQGQPGGSAPDGDSQAKPEPQEQQQQQQQQQVEQQAHGQHQETNSSDAACPVAIRLSLEESFFLKYTLSCITVIVAAAPPASASAPEPDASFRELSEQGLWDACRAVRPNFPISYAGYHHLKSKGWLPRSGLLYGVDYVLYQMHPTAVHSEFGVMLVPSSGPYRPDMRWLDVQITNRLINQVSKRLLLLYLHEAEGSPGHGSPACLDFFQAEERLLKRWVPSSTRDEKK